VGTGTTSALYRVPHPQSMRLFLTQLLQAREELYGTMSNDEQ
jgi:hypothetical protein